MATVYGQYSSDRLEDAPATKVPANAEHGRMRVAYDKYTASGAIAINTVIKMGKLPAGARVVGYWLKTSDLGTVGSLDLGWSASSDGSVSADADGFLDGVDVNAAAITVGHQDQENMAGLGKLFDSGVDIEILAAAATDAAGTIETCVYYVVD